MTLLAPLNIPSGSDVTLTIEAEAPGGVDTNYVVLRLSIVNTVKTPIRDHTDEVMNTLVLQVCHFI